MELNGHLVRNERVVWRDIAGEVVIAERDNSTIRVLNRTASLVWTLADGTRTVEDIIAGVCEAFEVSEGKAGADIEEFCQSLLKAKLITVADDSRQPAEAGK